MSQYDAFDNEGNGYQNKPQKEIWELGNIYSKDTWSALSDWLLGMKAYLIQENRERFLRIENNLALYKGIQYQSQYMKEDQRDYGTDRSKAVRKIAANHIYDLTQNKVSRLIKYRPGIAALPTSSELEDRVGATMSENLIRHIWYLQNFEGEVQNDFVKLTHLMGEAYLAVVWDKNKGEMVDGMKDYLNDINDKGEAILMDDKGSPELDEEGNPIKLTRIVKYGDTVYEIWFTLDCLVDKDCHSYKEAKHFWHKKLMSKSYAQKKYNLSDSAFIGSDHDNNFYDFERMQLRGIANRIACWSIFFKKCEELPKGAEIKLIGSKVVEVKPLDHESGFPVVRLTDVDLAGEVHGESYITFIKSLTGTYNNLTNMIIRNQILASHPKWVFPAGSVRKESLGNEITLVEYKGPTPPILAQQNPTPGEVFDFRKQLKEEFQQISGIFGVSRGEPPPGIKAGVALQFLAEQESERFNEMVLKYNEWIRQVAIKTIERCSENYKPDDKRMIMILGFQNKWMTSYFDVKYLSRKYDIRIQNASALPQSKAARTQYLLDLNEAFPNQVPPEMVLDMLDISQPDRFIDYVAASIKAAEAENESILRGTLELNDPKNYEDHIAMWRIHVKQMREWSFKNQTPEKIQKTMEDHVAAHEMFMVQRARKDPPYLEKCMQLEGWPIFFKVEDALPPPPPPPPAPGPTSVEAGAENNVGAVEATPDLVNQPQPSLIEQSGAENKLPESEGPIEPTTAI